MAETVCVNDTNGDGDCAACVRNPQAPCRQPVEVVIGERIARRIELFDVVYNDGAGQGYGQRQLGRLEGERNAFAIAAKIARNQDPALPVPPPADPYAHLSADERRTLAFHARTLAGNWHDRPDRAQRWKEIADELEATDD